MDPYEAYLNEIKYWLLLKMTLQRFFKIKINIKFNYFND